MNKTVLIMILLVLGVTVAEAQNNTEYSKDTQLVNRLNKLSYYYWSGDSVKKIDLALSRQYAEQALAIAEKRSYKRGLADALFNNAMVVMRSPTSSDNIAKTIFLHALDLYKNLADRKSESYCFNSIADCLHTIGHLDSAINYYDSCYNLLLILKDTAEAIGPLAMKGHCYYDFGNYKKAFDIGSQAQQLAQKTGDTLAEMTALVHLSNLFLGAGLPGTTIDYVHQISNLYPGMLNGTLDVQTPYPVSWGLLRSGEAFLKMGKIDSAEWVAKRVGSDTTDEDNQLFFGHLSLAKDDYKKAFSYFKKGLEVAKNTGHAISLSRHADEIAQTYLLTNDVKNALFYANMAQEAALKIPALLEMRNSAGTLRDIYIQSKNYGRAFVYSQQYKTLNDSLAPEEYRQKLSLIEIENQLQAQKQQASLLSKENEIKEQLLDKSNLIRKVLVGGILCLLLFAFFVIRNNGQKRKANTQLREQKLELESTLGKLKSTQNQLIQSEKMASLGELTAGIAHEIQNPLNFVNNFSEVNSELVAEMEEALNKGDIPTAKKLAADISANEEKINQHGKRADSIVKGMLQHSRSSAGQKEPTDINALVDEYLRLAYHGFRTKDKFFNATLHTSFDETIPALEIIPQDIGRVLLNIINNAFYYLSEKSKKDGADFQPGLWVTSRKTKNQVVISVRDNANGIPDKIRDKIFQPFFTTKPTGQGTGLGLSLAYDIIKAQGGDITVESNGGHGSEFLIALPSTGDTK